MTEDKSPIYCVAGRGVAGESDLTHWLTLHRPNWFPQILGHDPASNRLLLDTVPGTPLTECLTLENCKAAMTKLAELQIGLIGSSLPNLAEPLRDFRLCSLASSLDSDFHRLLDALKGECDQFRALSDTIRSTLRAVFGQASALCIPDSFVHADAAPPNIFVNRDHIRLIDLESAGWGFPFITAETLVRSEHILQHPQWIEALNTEYCRAWMTTLSNAQLQQGMYLTPIVRVWARLRRLVDISFDAEPERYWHPGLYRYLLVGYAQKLLRLTARYRSGTAVLESRPSAAEKLAAFDRDHAPRV